MGAAILEESDAKKNDVRVASRPESEFAAWVRFYLFSVIASQEGDRYRLQRCLRAR